MSDRLREEFEVWAKTNYSYFINPISRSAAGEYETSPVRRDWNVWKASRESSVIDLSDLSNCFSPNDCGDWAMWLDDVRILVQRAGLKVKL